HFQARLTGVADTSVTLRRVQFRAADDPGRCAAIARQIVAGKIQRLNMAAYCAAKASVIHFSKVAAFELAPHGVRVIAQCPGTTATDMVLKTITGGDPEALAKWLAGIPMGRLAEPEDQARLTAFLISDLASHITGQAINVDGGQVMW
ncbi:MAG TPA: SDR family oxidoreductase, partial [Spirochaetia bacterium]|nr:SDR family oxidoreductase [Spirochaetia bacterium]